MIRVAFQFSEERGHSVNDLETIANQLWGGGRPV